MAIRSLIRAFFLSTLAFTWAVPALAQQAPVQVERDIDAFPSSLQTVPDEGSDFEHTHALSPVADNVPPVEGYYPNSQTVVTDTTWAGQKNANIPPEYVAPPPAPALPSVRDLGQGRYMIAPAESPLLTAPAATLNPADLVQQTETEVPVSGTADVTQEDLSGEPLGVAPVAAPVTADDLAKRLSDMADRVDKLSTQADTMQERAAKIETVASTTTVAASGHKVAEAGTLPVLSATVPYVNDVTAVGPSGKKALDALVAQMVAAHAKSGAQPKNLSVVAYVVATPIGPTAKQLAKQRHLACWQYLNGKLAKHGMKLEGIGNSLTVKPAKSVSVQSQQMTVVWAKP